MNEREAFMGFALTVLTYACWHSRYEHPEMALIVGVNMTGGYLLLKLFGAFKSNDGW